MQETQKITTKVPPEQERRKLQMEVTPEVFQRVKIAAAVRDTTQTDIVSRLVLDHLPSVSSLSQL